MTMAISLPDPPDVTSRDFRQCGSIASLFAREHSQPSLALASLAVAAVWESVSMPSGIQ